MSQTTKSNPPKLRITQRAPGVSTGSKTSVELDGKPLPYIKFLKLEFHAAKTTKVTMEMYVEVDEIEIEGLELDLTDIVKIKGKDYVVGKYENINQQDQTSS